MRMNGGKCFGSPSATGSNHDREKRFYNAIWERYPNAILVLLNNRYVFAPFWRHQNGVPGYADWEARFESSKRWIAATGNSLPLLTHDLYV